MTTQTLKVTQLPNAGVLSGTELVPIVQAGTTKQVTTQQIADLFGGPGSGTVTSVGLSAPSIFSVTGSPITVSGTLALALANQSANQIFAGPGTGSAAAPTFRSLVAADIPNGLPSGGSTGQVLAKASGTNYDATWVADTGGTVTSVGLSAPAAVFSVTGTPVTTTGTLALGLATQSANVVFAGPSSGGAAEPTFRGIVANDLPTVPITKGGTGQTTASAAFDALAPTTTRGDLIYRNATTNTRLAASTSGYLLQTNGAGTDPTWSGFLQAGTGAVTRTWQTKLREVQVSVEDFGAVGDATSGGTVGTDDTAAFQAAIDYVSGVGGGVVAFSKRYLINGPLVVRPNVFLRGPVAMPGLALPSTTKSYDTLYGILYVDSANYIEVRWSAGIGNGYILRKGLTTPITTGPALTAAIAAFAGTAIQITNHDATLSNLLILGFADAVISGGSTGALGAPSRVRIDYVCGDCTNGITLKRVHDLSFVRTCEFWPYISIPYQDGGGSDWTLSTRSGTAFKWDKDVDPTTGDGSIMDGCFSFGWAVGFDIVGGLHMKLAQCITDYPGSLSSTSIGFRINTATRATTLLNCEAYAQGTAVQVDIGSNTAIAGNNQVIGFYGNANDTYHVHVVSGRLTLIGSSFYGPTGTGLYAPSTAGAITVTDNEFCGLVTPMDVDAAVLATVGTTIHSNRTVSTTNPAASDKLALRGSTATSSPFEVFNSADASAVQVGRRRGLRATPTANDLIYEAWELSDSAGNSTVAMRQNVRLSTVTDGAETAQVYWGIMSAGVLTDRLLFTPGALSPVTNDAMSLGQATLSWADLYGATGFTWNIANGDWVATHSTGVMNVTTGDLRVTTAGTNSASVVTVGGTQTLTSKTLTSPAITTSTSTSTVAATAASIDQNTTDNANVLVSMNKGARATPTANDTIYQDWRLNNASSAEKTAFRQSARLSTITAGAEAAQVFWGIMKAGALTDSMLMVPTALSPVTNDLMALGQATLGWADLFLASGGVINWNNGTFTLTQSGSTLTSSGTLATADLTVTNAPRFNQTPSAIGTGAKTISNAADSSTNFGHYLALNMNGTTYYVPCSAVAPT